MTPDTAKDRAVAAIKRAFGSQRRDLANTSVLERIAIEAIEEEFPTDADYVHVADGVCVRVYDNGRGVISYILQSRQFGRWYDKGRFEHLYNADSKEG